MNYRNTRNYENLEKRIYAGAGVYGIPVIEPVQVDGECEYIMGIFTQKIQKNTMNH